MGCFMTTRRPITGLAVDGLVWGGGVGVLMTFVFLPVGLVVGLVVGGGVGVLIGLRAGLAFVTGPGSGAARPVWCWAPSAGRSPSPSTSCSGPGSLPAGPVTMARDACPIYVEIAMKAPIDEVWRRSQDPDDHSRWDQRFTRVEMLDPTTVGAGTPRHFRYAVGPVTGVVVTSADRRLPDGSATSALRFSSNHRLSPIRSGTGYGRYRPACHDTSGGTKILTRYDYLPRGRADRLVRPLLGWATAWSFDRLRLWADEGVTPEQASGRALLEGAGRLLAGRRGCGACGGQALSRGVPCLTMRGPPRPAAA